MNITDCPNLPYHSLDQMKNDFLLKKIGFIFKPSIAMAYQMRNIKSAIFNNVSYLSVFGFVIYIIITKSWLWFFAIVFFPIVYFLTNPIAPKFLSYIVVLIILIITGFSSNDKIYALGIALLLYIGFLKMAYAITQKCFVEAFINNEELFCELWLNHQIALVKNNKKYTVGFILEK